MLVLIARVIEIVFRSSISVANFLYLEVNSLHRLRKITTCQDFMHAKIPHHVGDGDEVACKVARESDADVCKFPCL